MKGRFLTKETLEQFKLHLLEEEKSAATVEKYLRDTAAFMAFLAENEATKELAMAYKQELIDDGYAVRSINSMLASINGFFCLLPGCQNCHFLCNCFICPMVKCRHLIVF